MALDFAEARRIFHAAEEARLGWWKLQSAIVEAGQMRVFAARSEEVNSVLALGAGVLLRIAE